MLTTRPRSQVARYRLQRAARARASIDHPNVVPARVHREHDGRVGTIVARCPQPLIRELAGSSKLDVERCVLITRGACAAVDAMAIWGLVPRDLTPDKIYVHGERGGVLADSGVPLELVPRAPMAEDAHLSYRSPEELDGGVRDERSVVYSLGAVLYACLVGRDPFGGSWSNIYLAHSTAPRPSAREQRADVPAALDAVIARAMAVRPADRYASVHELGVAAAAATRARETLPVPAPIEPHDVAPAAPEQPRETPPREIASRNGNGNGAGPKEADPVGRPVVTEAQPARATLPSARREEVVRRLKPLGLRARAHASTQERRKRGSRADRKDSRGEAEVRPARAPKRPAPLGMERAGKLMVAVALGVVGVLSALAAVTAGDSDAQSTRVEAGPLSAIVPAGWHRIDAGNALTARSRDGDSELVARVMPGPSDADNMLGAMLKGSGSPKAMKLGALEAQRYDLANRSEAYVVSTTGESILIVCRTRGSAQHACADAAATVQLDGERPITLGAARTRMENAIHVMQGLGAARFEERARLASAPVAEAQAGSAERLARRYGAAADELKGTGIAGARMADLVAALRTNGDAYHALATALTAGRGYDAAREAVVAAEPAVTRSARLLFR